MSKLCPTALPTALSRHPSLTSWHTHTSYLAVCGRRYLVALNLSTPARREARPPRLDRLFMLIIILPYSRWVLAWAIVPPVVGSLVSVGLQPPLGALTSKYTFARPTRGQPGNPRSNTHRALLTVVFSSNPCSPGFLLPCLAAGGDGGDGAVQRALLPLRPGPALALPAGLDAL